MTRTALIQGGSGGIGAALMDVLLESEQFDQVLVTARDISAIQSKDPRVQPIELDLTSDASIETAADSVRALTDRLHLVITTAGVLKDDARDIRPEKKLTDLNRATLMQVFDVNCFGPFLWYKAIYPCLRHREPLKIATLSARVASIDDNRLGGWHSYRASKTAQNMLTQNLSLELRRTNPHAIVVGLHPGTVDTALSKPFQSGVAPDKLFSAEQSAGYLWSVLSELSAEHSGQVIDWNQQTIPR
jgi:NAD(P)-dependent dehydrogenase (short-subunit alcohol dehydrogenase family)